MLDIDIADLKQISALIYQKYHYDFRNYAMSSFKRRVLRIMEIKRLTVDDLLGKLNNGSAFIHEFLAELTVDVTEMFRDPSFWRIMREEILPGIMLNHEQFKIWHAGCSSGEEVLSMSIVLKELGVLPKVTMVATDLDTKNLEKARIGSYPIRSMALNEKNYFLFRGIGSLKDYYEEKNSMAVFDKELLANVSFRSHDLVVGDTFGRFDLIVCRNVMTFFNQTLQNEVLKKFHGSLFKYGYLALGSKESLIWCDYANRFIVVNNEEKIYRKIKD